MSNSTFGYPVSVFAGDSVMVGQKYFLHKNKFMRECPVYDLYEIEKLAKRNNLVCYALLYKLNSDNKALISEEITKENIDGYGFQLNKEDAQKIKLNEEEILIQ